MNKKTANLKKIFSEILFGYSSCKYKDRKFKIKHLTPKEDMELDFYYQRVENEAEKKGYPTEEEKIKELISSGIWSEEKDLEIKRNEEHLKGIIKTKEKLFQRKMIEELERNENKVKKQIQDLQVERYNLLYPTREDYINKRINDYYIFLSLVDDHDNPIFDSFSDFDEEDDDIIINYRGIFLDVYRRISYDNIKKISVSQFFLELFICCGDNPMTFYGDSVKNLTNFQVLLFNTGKKYKDLIQNSDSEIPQEYFEDPDKLIAFVNKSKNEQEAESKNKFENRGIMDDGLDSDFNKKMREKAKANGGELGMEELMKMHSGF